MAVGRGNSGGRSRRGMEGEGDVEKAYCIAVRKHSNPMLSPYECRVLFRCGMAARLHSGPLAVQRRIHGPGHGRFIQGVVQEGIHLAGRAGGIGHGRSVIDI